MSFLDLEKADPEWSQPSPSSLIVCEHDVNGTPFAFFSGEYSRNLKRTLQSPDHENYFGAVQRRGSTIQNLINIFLPTGFPDSVQSDYLDYQIYDSVQAFSSSIAGLLANRCVLVAMGVGNSTETSTSALFLKILQETVGRLGTIMFAWRLGSTLEPECKKFRFVADIINDAAIVFDCMSPMFPGNRNSKVILMCASGILRSICGVMAGGSRAALTQHFTHPTKGSIADVNAKDQSQETVITLMGMLVGSVVIGKVEGEGLYMWVVLLSLLTIHLWTNYNAVASVIMQTINRQRANILFSDIIRILPELESNMSGGSLDNSKSGLSKLIMSPRSVASRERILEWDGVLRWYETSFNKPDSVLGYANFVGFSDILNVLHQQSFSISLLDLMSCCSTELNGYLIWFQVLHGTNRVEVKICLTKDNDIPDSEVSLKSSGTKTQEKTELRAWCHALLIAKYIGTSPGKSPTTASDYMECIRHTEATVDNIFGQLQIMDNFRLAGWDIERCAIISAPTKSISIKSKVGIL
ncbi:DUF647-domain-containing protein [Nadsonia fulvescens var. elongata DSM 6958]|uniref:DUF647-domain-containing protein n=1 Tax=Nadsonia fulvescens var. elongata DSM 6958 TaxID=857566 RepID=A0A1E3PQP7_9ASCO|nr:DUF647-domain-containing protein [Nadsonia fulvescens var. elongata DSM 6958]